MKYEKLADISGHFLFARYDKDLYHKIVNSPSFHNSIEILFLISGEMEIIINGERKKISGKKIVYIDKFVPHEIGIGEGMQHENLLSYVLVVSSVYLSSLPIIENFTLPQFMGQIPNFDMIVSLLEQFYPIKDEMNEETKSGFVSLIFGLIHQNVPLAEKKNDKATAVFLKIMQYIDEHYKEDINLNMLSVQFGYEKTYLSRILNNLLGMNFREYLNRIRIDKAQKLKSRLPDAPIYKIAEESGFNSLNTFYRAYGKYSKSEHNHNF